MVQIVKAPGPWRRDDGRIVVPTEEMLEYARSKANGQNFFASLLSQHAVHGRWTPKQAEVVRKALRRIERK